MSTREEEAFYPSQSYCRGRWAQAAGPSGVFSVTFLWSRSSESLDYCSPFHCSHQASLSGSHSCWQQIQWMEGEVWFYTQIGSATPSGQHASEWDEADSLHQPSLSAGVCSPEKETIGLRLPSESCKWNVTVSAVFLSELIMEQDTVDTLLWFDLLPCRWAVKAVKREHVFHWHSKTRFW